MPDDKKPKAPQQPSPKSGFDFAAASRKTLNTPITSGSTPAPPAESATQEPSQQQGVGGFDFAAASRKTLNTPISTPAPAPPAKKKEAGGAATSGGSQSSLPAASPSFLEMIRPDPTSPDHTMPWLHMNDESDNIPDTRQGGRYVVPEPKTPKKRVRLDNKTFLRQDLNREMEFSLSNPAGEKDILGQPKTVKFAGEKMLATDVFEAETRNKVDDILSDPKKLFDYRKKRVSDIRETIKRKGDEAMSELNLKGRLDEEQLLNIRGQLEKLEGLDQLRDYQGQLTEAVVQEAFPDVKSAKDYLHRELTAKKAQVRPRVQGLLETPKPIEATQDLDGYDLSSIISHVDKNDDASIAAITVYQKHRILDDIIKTTPDLQEAALKFMATQDPVVAREVAQLTTSKSITEYPEAKAGKIVSDFLEIPEVMQRAVDDPEFYKRYQQTSANLYSHFPTYAIQQVGEKIGQEREDRGMNSMIFNNPSYRTTDPLVEELVKNGQTSRGVPFTENDRIAYQNLIRPQLLKSAFARNWGPHVIPTPDIVNTLVVGGLGKGIEDIASTAHAINPLSPLTNELGLTEGWKARTKRLINEEYAAINIDPKNINQGILDAAHFTGYMAPMILGGLAFRAAGVGTASAEALTNFFMFGGQNYDNARKLYGDDLVKVAMSTIGGISFDMMAGKLLPTRSATTGLKKIYARRVGIALDNLTAQGITEGTIDKVKGDLFKGVTKYMGKLVKKNVEASAVMAGFGAFHNGWDSILGGRDMSGQEIIRTAVHDFITGLPMATAVSAVGAYGEMRPKLRGKIIRNVAENADYYKKIIQDGASINPDMAQTANERIHHLNQAEIIWNGIDKATPEKPLTEAQKEKYLVTSLKQKAWEERAKQATDETIKSDYEKKANKLKKIKEAIYNGEDKAPEHEVYDNSHKEDDGFGYHEKINTATTEAEKEKIDQQYADFLAERVKKEVPEEAAPAAPEVVPVEKVPESIPSQEVPPVIEQGREKAEQVNPPQDAPAPKPETLTATPKMEAVVTPVESHKEIEIGQRVRWRGLDFSVTSKNGDRFDLRGVNDLTYTVKGAEITDPEFEGRVEYRRQEPTQPAPTTSPVETAPAPREEQQLPAKETIPAPPITQTQIRTDDEAIAALTPDEKQQHLDHIANGDIEAAQAILDTKKRTETPPPSTPQATEIRRQNIGDLDQRINTATDQDKKTVLTSVKKVADAVTKISQNAKVVIHDTRESFIDAYKRAGGKGNARGFFDNGNEIHINLQDANNETAFHEGAHSVFKHLFNSSPEFTNKFHAQLQKILPDVHKKNLENFVEQGYGSADEITKRDEYVTEFFARVASGRIDLDKVPQTTFEKIKELLRRTAESIGLNPKFIGLDSKQDVVAFARRLSDAFNEGKVIRGSEKVRKILTEENASENQPLSDGPTEIKSDIKGQAIVSKEFTPEEERNLKGMYYNPKQWIDEFRQKNNRNPRIWFWAGDGIKRGEYKNPRTGVTVNLDGGVGYGLDKKNLKNKAAWATNMPAKTIKGRLANTDLVSIVMGSKRGMHYSNLAMADVVGGEILAGLKKNKVKEFSFINEIRKSLSGKTDKTSEPLRNFMADNPKIRTIKQLTDAIKTKANRGELLKLLLPEGDKKHKEDSVKGILQKHDIASIDEINQYSIQDFKNSHGYEMGDVVYSFVPNGKVGKAGEGDFKGVDEHGTYKNVIGGDALGMAEQRHKVWDYVPEWRVERKGKLTESASLASAQYTGKVAEPRLRAQAIVENDVSLDNERQRATATAGEGTSRPEENTGKVRYNGTDVIGSRGRPRPEKDAGEQLAKEKIKNPQTNVALHVADKYNESAGLPKITQHKYKPSDSVLQPKISDVFQQLKDVTSPDYKETELEKGIYQSYKDKYPDQMQGIDNYKQLVEKSYAQLAKEADAQYKALTKDIKVDFHQGDKNYTSSAEMLDDVHNFGHLWVFRGGDDHTLLGSNTVDENGLTANDKFRAVHDFFGHSIEGYQFGKNGEENAWIEHSKMFSPLAQIALSSETRGQNSVVNYSGINAVPLEKIKTGAALKKKGEAEGNQEMVTEGQRLIDEANIQFNFAEQKSVALPADFTDTSKYTAEKPTVRAQAAEKASFEERRRKVQELLDKGHITPEQAQATMDRISEQERAANASQGTPSDTGAAAPPPEGEKAATAEPAQKPTSSIRNATVSEKRKELNLPLESGKTKMSDKEVRAAAEQAIKKGFNVKELIDHVLDKKDQLSTVETELVSQYVAGKEAEIRSYNEDIERAAERGEDIGELMEGRDKSVGDLVEAYKATELSGSEQGRAFRYRQKTRLEEDSLAKRFIDEAVSSNVTKLLPEQIEMVQKEYEKEKAVNDKLKKKIRNEQAKNRRLKAKENIEKVKRVVPKKEGKPKGDFQSERKNIANSIFEKINKLRGGGMTPEEQQPAPKSQATEGGEQPMDLTSELTAIAPDVHKLLRSFVEEGVTRHDQVIDGIHEILQQGLPEITKEDVNDILAGEYNKKRTPKSEIKRQIENINIQSKLIKKLEDVLEGYDQAPLREKIKRNAQIEALQNNIADYRRTVKKAENEALRELKQSEKEANIGKPRTPEEIKKILGIIKKRYTAEKERLQKKLDKGDYAPDEKRKPVELDAEARQLKEELQQLRKDRTIRLAKQMIQNREWWSNRKGVLKIIPSISNTKTVDILTESFNLPRTIMASFDYSAPLRQGVVASFAHPILAFSPFKRMGVSGNMERGAFWEMFKQGWDEKKYDGWLDDVYHSEFYPVMKEAGLYIADQNNRILNAKEERYMSNIAERLPVIGRFVKGSERAYTAYLNKMRVDVFMQAADAFMKEGMTPDNHPEMYKAWADFVNASTGRGSLGKFEESAQILNSAFFSPRLIASRVSLLVDAATFGGYKDIPLKIRVMKMRDLLSFSALAFSTLMLAKLASQAIYGKDEVSVESNILSSDFGRVKVGETRFDVMGGFQPYVVFVDRFARAKMKTIGGDIKSLKGDKFPFKTRADLTLRFFRGKLAPIPGTIWSLSEGKDIAGSKFNIEDALMGFAPMIWQDVQDAYKDGGLKRAIGVGATSMWGIGASTYTKKKKIE